MVRKLKPSRRLRRYTVNGCELPGSARASQNPPMKNSHTLHAETPSEADYLRLRVVAGLTPKTAQAAAAGLPNTLFAIVVRSGDDVVGMGRVVGDGGLFYQVVDMAVTPEHQGCGLGTAIMQRLMAYIDEHAPTGAYVSLIADGEANRLYARFGFEPTAPRSIGMAFVVGKRLLNGQV